MAQELKVFSFFFAFLFLMLPKLTKFANGVELGDWRIELKRSPILNSENMEKLTEDLGLPIVPEMVFGQSFVAFTHKPSKTAIVFDAIDSLKLVSKDPCPVEVHAAKRWKERKVEESGEDTLKALQSQTQAFDWTFHTPYTGTLARADSDTPVTVTESTDSLDIPLLQRQDPILFSGELILFEDELADNGSSTLVVKLRVMPTFWFVLMRQFVRVDGVIFKLNDTRYFHKYGTDSVYREHHEREGMFAQVAPRLPPDPAAVNDVQAVLPHLKLMKQSKESIKLESK